MKFFDTPATREALDFATLIPSLKKAFIKGCLVPLRHSHTINCGDGNTGPVLIMPAWEADRYLGIKTVNFFPATQRRGMPGLHSTYVLYDAGTGEPLAQMDGNEITSRRTAAASALAATLLARDDSSHMVLLGAGLVASLVPAAYRSQLPITHVEVWDIYPESAARLVQQLRGEGFNAAVVSSLPDSVARADVVSCATLATEPIVRGAWLRPGTHLDLIGSFTPQMREADDDCFRNARVFVDTDEALRKSGDLIGPLSRNVIALADLNGTLAALCRGDVGGRFDGSERTVFKAVGTALEDLAAATQVYEKHV